MTPTVCPDCGEDLKPRATRCACGWRAPARQDAPATPAGLTDREYGWCEWRSGSERCRYPGVLSRSTHGGRFYCLGHDGCDDPIVAGQMVEESILACGNSPDYSQAGRMAAYRAAWALDDQKRASTADAERGRLMARGGVKTVGAVSDKVTAHVRVDPMATAKP